MGLIIREICPDLTKYHVVLCATAKVMTELCSDSIEIKKKILQRRTKPMWKERTEREIKHMRGELSILTELQR